MHRWSMEMTRWRLHMIVACLHIAACLHPRLMVSQVEYGTWVLGNNAVLTFDDGSGAMLDTPRLLPSMPFSTLEGSAVYTDPCTRQLAIFSNGEAIYDRRGQQVPIAGPVGGGVSSSQNGVILRDPADVNRLFYIVAPCLTWPCTEPNTSYLVHHLERTAGTWAVRSSRDLLIGRGSERIAATQDADLAGSWVVTFDVAGGSPMLRAFHITNSGIAQDPVQSMISVPLGPIGTMKFSPDGSRLAIVDAGTPRIVVMSFDRSTGAFSRTQVILLDSVAGSIQSFQGFGVSFSMGGRFLYCTGWSRSGNASAALKLVRCDLANLPVGNATVTPELVLELDQRLHRLYDLPPMPQLAPNGKIYVPNFDALAVVHDPDASTLVPTSVDARGVPMPAVMIPTALGLPTCDESTFLFPTERRLCLPPQASIKANDTCVGSCVIAHITTSTDATNVTCTFPGGMPSVWKGSFPPPVCYGTPGTYIISVVAENANGTTITHDTIMIVPTPDVTAGTDQDVCPGGVARLQASGARTYRWSPASLLDDPTSDAPVTRTLTASTWFVVAGTDERGCTGSDSVFINVGMLRGSISPDTVICEGTALEIIARGGTSCRWIDDPSETRYVRIVKPMVTTTYSAILSDGSCSDTVSVRIGVEQRPFDLRRSAFRGCPEQPVQLDIGSRAVSVRWSPTDGLSDPLSHAPICTTASTRSYVVTQRTISGCERMDTVWVNIDRYRDTLLIDTTCCEGELVKISVGDTVVTSVVDRDQLITFDRRLDAHCMRFVSVLIRRRPPVRTLVTIGTAASEVGDEVSIPLTISTSRPGATIDLTMRPTSSVLWRSPWNGAVRVVLADAEQTVFAVGTTMLAGDSVRTLDVDVYDPAPCTDISSVAGRLRVFGCAIRERQLAIVEPLTITSTGPSVWRVSGGVGWRKAYVVNLLGEMELLEEGDGSLDVQLRDRARCGPCFLVVTDAVQRRIFPLITP